MSVLRFFMLLSLVVWVGGIIFFSFVVAPALFNILPTRHLSGLVVSRCLALLHWIGVVAGGVFLICSAFEAYHTTGSVQAMATRNVLVFAMVVATLFSQVGVSTRMAALKAEMGEIDTVSLTDPRRLAFNNLHRWSTGLEVVVLLLGLAAIYVIARQWAIPVVNALSERSVSTRA
ncbi:MAG: DUF4149 domain-containing protein [Terriglobales bacterium]